VPVVVFCDNDLSAANGDHRPGLDALIAAVRRGEIAQVVCAEQSRLTRRPAEWEDLVVTLAKAGIAELHTYRKGVVNVSGSKLVGRILSAVDAEEIEVLRPGCGTSLSGSPRRADRAAGESLGTTPSARRRGAPYAHLCDLAAEGDMRHAVARLA
jgi:DNA invertase Pin-like site-specific DNA recombinase